MQKLNINELTVEQKIGQLLVARSWKDEEDRRFVFEMLKMKAVGGMQVIYYEGCEAFIAEMKECAGYPLLVCADMENGFPGSDLQIPAQMSLSATDDPELAYELARLVAIEAKNAGFNVIWGPVVDLSAVGALCKNTRCFGDDVQAVSRYACAMIRGYQDEGMVVSAKHFPGGSDILDDQHLMAGVSYLSEEELLEKDMVPYLEAMKQVQLSGIMTAHNLFPKIDDTYVASLSPKVIDIIRKQGFDGVIFSDSLAMLSVVNKYGEKQSLGLAIAAGNDILLPSYRLSFRESYEALLDAYRAGVFSEERLNEAVRRVIEAQNKTLQPPTAECLTENQKGLITELSKKSLCVQVTADTEVKLGENTKKAFILLCENSYENTNVSKELQNAGCYDFYNVEMRKKMLEAEFPGATVLIIHEHPSQSEVEEASVAIAKADETILFTFCRAACYLASDGLTDRMRYLIKVNEKKISTIVHMGNPYVIRDCVSIPRVLWGTIGGGCEEYAVKALKGEFVPTGKLPVEILRV